MEFDYVSDNRAEGALRFSHVALDCQITVSKPLILAPLPTDIPISYMSPNGTTDVCVLGRSQIWDVASVLAGYLTSEPR